MTGEGRIVFALAFVCDFFLQLFILIDALLLCLQQVASDETTFEALPWNFDNVYVGESIEAAFADQRRRHWPTRDVEAKLASCPFQPYSPKA